MPSLQEGFTGLECLNILHQVWRLLTRIYFFLPKWHLKRHFKSHHLILSIHYGDGALMHPTMFIIG
jgi:hypothetical protein